MAITRKDFLKLASITSVSGLVPTVFDSPKDEDKTAKLIKPKRLKKGNTIGLVAPASPIYEDVHFDEMLVDLEILGFNYVLGKHVKDKYGYLAGSDTDRAEDLMNMFKNDAIDGIICVRGGWGCNRILPYLDFDAIRANPKALVGFSDITSLHSSIHKKAGVVTFHGPVGKSDWNEFSLSSFVNVVEEGKKEIYTLPEDQTDAFTIYGGKAKGRLIGGNLTVLVAMIGSDYLPDFKGTILFLEDVGEDVYRIDRMITQLKLSGILGQVNGVVFGKCSDCEGGVNSLTLQQVFADHIKPLGIPAFYGAMISHEKRNITLPIGVKAEIDAESYSIRLLESGVSV